MKSKVILFLIVLTILFSIVSIVSDLGISQITGGTTQGLINLPLTFNLVVIILLIVIISIILTDLIISKKQS